MYTILVNPDYTSHNSTEAAISAHDLPSPQFVTWIPCAAAGHVVDK